MSSFPDTFYCALTSQIMVDPATDPENHNYEYSAIEDYLKGHNQSPITGNPLSIDQIQRNDDLKQQIDAIRSQVDDATRFRNLNLLKKAPEQVIVVEEEERKIDQAENQIVEEQPLVSIQNLNADNTKPQIEISRLHDYVRIKINTPEGTKRSPCDICCVIDVSGSMGDEVKAKDSNGKAESDGLTILDLVKHSVKTIIENLNEGDRLSIVSFTDTAQKETDLIEMSKAGKEITIKKLETLEPLNSTNIWDGIAKGLEVMKSGVSDNDNRKAFSQILLFTDGMPNIIPPRGHLQMLKKYKEDHPEVNCSLSTFGFGYNLDSELLDQLAIEGKGSYAFIPDAQFVGTVFVNALSNLMTTLAVDSTLCLENSEFSQFGGNSIQVETAKGVVDEDKSVLGGLDNQQVSWGLNINIGTLQYGQSRDIIIKMKNIDSNGSQPYVRATLKYKTSSSQKQVEEVSSEGINRNNDENVISQVFRVQTVDIIKKILPLYSNEKAKDVQSEVQALSQAISSHPLIKTDKFLKDLSVDVSGQITEAISKSEYFTRWGRHYLRSLCRAHQTQQCNNFKDPGVQHYGGKLFGQARDTADEIFLKIPPPVPSIKQQTSNAYSYGSSYSSYSNSTQSKSSAPAQQKKVSMKNYYSCSAPCFSGDSLVTISNENASPINTTKKVSEIRKGDFVISPEKNNQLAKVLCVIKTPCANNKAFLVKLSESLQITPYHPVRINKEWKFPCAIEEAYELPCDAVYSFVLESGHTMKIGGIECVTYAHNFQEEVVKHAYFGTENILNDFKAMKGWQEGYITLETNCLIRDPNSRLVIGLKACNNYDEVAV